jgi:hypothetical protein
VTQTADFTSVAVPAQMRRSTFPTAMRSFSTFIFGLSAATASGCVQEPPTTARDAALDQMADSLADRIVDDRDQAVLDQALDVSVERQSDHIPDVSRDVGGDVAPDAGADSPIDGAADAGSGLDQVADSESRADTGLCVAPVVVIPPQTLGDATSVPISTEDALAYGCNPQGSFFRPMMRAFTLTKPWRLVMDQRHNLLPPPQARFAATKGCSSKDPLISSGGERCTPTVVDLVPGTYGLVECYPFPSFVYSFEDTPSSRAPNVNCAGSVNLIYPSAGYPEPRILDAESRYYTFTVPMLRGNPTTRVGFLFSDISGEAVRVTVRRICADGTSEVGSPLYVRFCGPYNSVQTTLQLAPGSYTAIVSDIPVGTKYTVKLVIDP